NCLFNKIDIAGPGFINFFLKNSFWTEALQGVLRSEKEYGKTGFGKKEKVLVEFVSANPTGPLHVGHGRGAVVGDVVGNILSWAGYDVQKEYYINDTGLQMETLGRSVLVRYKQLLGKEAELPENAYQGEYIVEIARKVQEKEGDKLLETGEEGAVAHFSKFACNEILTGIRDDLKSFNIFFDTWYSETGLHEKKEGAPSAKTPVEEALDTLVEQGHMYEKDSALWLKTTDFSDDKDRVVRRGSGVHTYFASDIAYHHDKFKRGYRKLINILGADHHGYVPRLSSAIQAMGHSKESLSVILIQLVNLKRGKEVVSMSTRRGKFETLSDLIADVGSDAARFFFVARSSDAQLDFDIELAKSQSAENPVYYVQYAHARICSIFRQAKEKGVSYLAEAETDLSPLSDSADIQMIKKILSFPDLIDRMAERLEPHLLTHFIHGLVADFHSYYNQHRIISDDEKLTKARLALVRAIQIVIYNSLTILGVSAPERM
ncbi:MAG: arginine--tRNA ligase, partial [Nitrospinota bacterium]